MSRIANPFRYSFDAPYKSTTCVFKLWFGTRYFIWKTKSLHAGINKIAIELDRKLRLGFEPDNFYAPILRYIRSARIGLFRVEVLKETEDPAELLIFEFKALQAAKDDKKCLNKIFEPQVPQWVPVEARQQLETAIAESKKPKPVKKKSLFNRAAINKRLSVLKGKNKKDVIKKAAPRKKAGPAKNTKVRTAGRGGRK